MKNFLKTTFLFLVLSAAAWDARALTPDDAVKFQEANKQYREGHYDAAIKLYQDLSVRYPEESTFYYDLGNSYFRSKFMGPALLAYERARWFSPRNRDVVDNLNYVRGLLEYRVEDKRNWYLRFGEKFLEYFTEREVHFLALLSFFVFAGAWSVSLFFNHGGAWGWKRKTLLWIFIFFGVIATAKNLETHMMRDAIVMKAGEVRYGPSDTDQIAFRLGEGLKVHVLESREGWSRILLVNGDSGWMKNDQIATVSL